MAKAITMCGSCGKTAPIAKDVFTDDGKEVYDRSKPCERCGKTEWVCAIQAKSGKTGPALTMDDQDLFYPIWDK